MKFNAAIAATALFLVSGCDAIYYSLYTDTNCQVFAGSINAENSTCSSPGLGWSSMRIATAPADGGLTFYSSEKCTEDGASVGGTSTLFLGCINIGFEAHSAQLE